MRPQPRRDRGIRRNRTNPETRGRLRRVPIKSMPMVDSDDEIESAKEAESRKVGMAEASCSDEIETASEKDLTEDRDEIESYSD